VVLSYSGSGCAAYRTIDGAVGTAFGWGVAKTKEAADEIATKECLRRSNGTVPGNFVWTCNSANAGPLKELYNANGELFRTVKIGDQEWMAENLNTVRFQNGDLVPEAKTFEQYNEFFQAKKPAFIDWSNLPGQQGCGKIYNLFAVLDPRGLAPKGWHIPTADEWKVLVAELGGHGAAAAKLAATDYNYVNGTNETGFNGLGCAAYNGAKPLYDYGVMTSWWSNTIRGTDYANDYVTFNIRSYDSEITTSLASSALLPGHYVRCVKD
jgi:uncharacterized protein (TIGR02145 family)